VPLHRRLSCSWKWPDAMCADAVDATIVKGEAPAFLISRKGDLDSADIASGIMRPDRDRALAARALSLCDHERAGRALCFLRSRRRPTPLWPTCQTRSVCRSIAFTWSCECFFDNAQSTGRRFVCGRDRLGMFHGDIDCFCMFECEAGQGRALDRMTAR
jgi:hypothetical protein